MLGRVNLLAGFVRAYRDAFRPQADHTFFVGICMEKRRIELKDLRQHSYMVVLDAINDNNKSKSR